MLTRFLVICAEAGTNQHYILDLTKRIRCDHCICELYYVGKDYKEAGGSWGQN